MRTREFNRRCAEIKAMPNVFERLREWDRLKAELYRDADRWLRLALLSGGFAVGCVVLLALLQVLL